MKKILAGISIITLLVTGFISAPKKAEAQWAVIDPVNLVQNVIGTISEVGGEILAYSDNYKEYVLDPLVSGLAKQIIRTITGSIVNWINSGFEGSPTFVQNPGAFFLDIADQATGQFIAQSGPLSALCSPYSIDIRLALSFKYRPNTQQRYACTLGTIIKNTKNAAENASINGFTAGDFQQGGWPAFISLTQEPQNNIYGAYLQADTELSVQVAGMQARQQSDLFQGRGFLSMKKCVEYDGGANYAEGSPEAVEVANRQATGQGLKCLRYETTTPGAVIAGALDTQLGSPARQLELADEIGEILNALFAQFTQQLLQKGLATVSKPDASGSSYLNTVTAEIQNSAEVVSVRNEILSGIDKQLGNAQRLKQNTEDAYKIVFEIKNSFEATKACYISKMTNSQPALSASSTALAQARITTIDNRLNGSDFITLYEKTEREYQVAVQKYNTLIRLRGEAQAAKTMTEISGPADEFGKLIRVTTTEIDIQNAKENIDKVKTATSGLGTEANSMLSACQRFPSN